MDFPIYWRDQSSNTIKQKMMKTFSIFLILIFKIALEEKCKRKFCCRFVAIILLCVYAFLMIPLTCKHHLRISRVWIWSVAECYIKRELKFTSFKLVKDIKIFSSCLIWLMLWKHFKQRFFKIPPHQRRRCSTKAILILH